MSVEASVLMMVAGAALSACSGRCSDDIGSARSSSAQVRQLPDSGRAPATSSSTIAGPTSEASADAGVPERSSRQRLDDWLPSRSVAPVEPARGGDACLLEDLEYMQAPLFRVTASPGEAVALRATLPGHAASDAYEIPPSVPARALVLGGVARSGFRCVYATTPGRLFAGFAPAEMLERVSDPPPEAPANLAGDWFEGGCGTASCGTPNCPSDHVRVSAEPAATVHILGEASWRCGFHVGSFDGRLRVVDGAGENVEDPNDDSEWDCRLRLRQRGPFLMLADNGNCGGYNVRFVGIYVRSPAPIPFQDISKGH